MKEVILKIKKRFFESKSPSKIFMRTNIDAYMNAFKEQKGDSEKMTTNMELLAHRVEQWAKERGLNNPDNSTAQALKLFEEAGELAQAHLKEREQDGKDAVGDILVVLTIYCQQKGWSIAECFELAYNEIKNRKGKMVNGSFVKSEDLR
jgi:NTP pyrophosphatase (non-canonical NTP hydrolase)